jgi:PAS domain S-box-containing protein
MNHNLLSPRKRSKSMNIPPFSLLVLLCHKSIFLYTESETESWHVKLGNVKSFSLRYIQYNDSILDSLIIYSVNSPFLPSCRVYMHLFITQSLKKEVHELVKENNHLKTLVRTLEPDVAENILKDCCTELPEIVAAIANQATSVLARADFSLITTICSAQRSFCISDPSLPDNPIVFASQDFLELTGYSMDDILGRNCRFLQGPATDLTGVAVLRKGIGEGVDTSVTLLNYRKDGSTFWNQIYLSALRDSEDNVVNYVGVQIEVFPTATEQLNSRGKNDGEVENNQAIKKSRVS